MWLERVAGGEGLRGWVRNRVEGTVEALLIGPAETVERVAAACARGPRLALVSVVAREAAIDTGRRISARGRPNSAGSCRRRGAARRRAGRPRSSGRFGFLALVLRRAEILALGLGIAVDQLDHRHRRGVAVAEAGLDDAAIAARPVP